jgi:autotransporter-associated beta strand protein
MKVRHRHHPLPLLFLTASIAVITVPGNTTAATNQYWNLAADGMWSNSNSPADKNWNVTWGALSGNTTWPDTGNEVAVFQDSTGSTVTVFTPVLCAGIVQNNADFIINGDTITLVPDLSPAAPFIHVQAGTLTITSILDGTSGLVKTGSGDLLLSNINSYTGTTSLTAGSLTLDGSLASATLDIAPGAQLLDTNGGLSNLAAVTNNGTLTVNAVAEEVASYTATGGMLAAGTGVLTTSTANLNAGSGIAGQLSTNALTSNAAVAISGSGNVTAGTIDIASGVLTNAGTLTATTRLNIATGATLAANGIHNQALLTTSGAGTGTWQGNLTNTTAVAPGGIGGIGTLLVANGNFTNSPGATLTLDIASAAHDLLVTSGTASLGGSLVLSQAGAGDIAPMVPITVVAAGAYAGNFTTLSENLDGAVWFNPANGTITRIAYPGGGNDPLAGSTANQKSTWVALYDDVIDPGTPNVGGYAITSGIANGSNPDLLWALAASATPAGLDAALLNRLSPEVYASLADYATHATRSHQRSALAAPTLATRSTADGKTDGKDAARDSSKGGCKDAAAVKPATLQWELFAAADYFNVATTNSKNQADYELSSLGIMVGARTHVAERIQLAAYLAADDGRIDGTLVDADGRGWSLGVLGEAMLDEASRTRLSAGVSYGRYDFDGNRGSAAATSGGWIPHQADFSDVTTDAWEIFIGVEGMVYHNSRLRLIPSLGMRAATATMDAFTEKNGGTAGSAITLDVDTDHDQSLLAEFSLLAEADITRQLVLSGLLGATAGCRDNAHELSGHFVSGQRPLRAQADGLSDDSCFIGVGATYTINDACRVSLGYRSEFRSGTDNLNAINLSSTIRF